MGKIQFLLQFSKKSVVILSLILITFFSKEVFLTVIFPIFEGQDESRHYNTIQYLSEPKEKNWQIDEKRHTQDKDHIETYSFSQEIRETARATDIYTFRKSQYDKTEFQETRFGKNETVINNKPWLPYNMSDPPDIVGKPHLYHKLGSLIEQYFSNESILFRFYVLRIFSVLLGTLTILLSYFIFKNIGFEQKESLLLTAVLSFQPKFSTYYTNINYDALVILIFFIFTLGAILFVKNGPKKCNVIIMTLAVIVGFFTKGTSLILAAILFGLLIHRAYNHFCIEKGRKMTKRQFVYLGLILVALMVMFSKNFNVDIFSPFKSGRSISESVSELGDYFWKSIPKISSSTSNYWGELDWVRNNYSTVLVNLLKVVDALALMGVVWYFVSKNRPKFLPEKKYAYLLFMFLIALQIGIRYYDWKVFQSTGKLLLGTPGRYFLPNIASHLAIMSIGIGMLIRNKRYFNIFLQSLLVIMFLLSMFTIFNILIPRLYL